LLLGSTAIDYFSGRVIVDYPRFRKASLWFSITGNLSILGVFKYFNFFAENIVAVLSSAGLEIQDPFVISILVPVGISFYTFQSMSYTIDVYRGEREPIKNFSNFAMYVAFFPQLVAGPIERANHLLPQVVTSRHFNYHMIVDGVDLLIKGLVLKLIVANNIAIYSDKVFMLDQPGVFLLLLGSIAFSIQIYADFFGYTLMARGLASMLGFKLSVNFLSPYLAVSPSDFWRRWHISLSSFVRDYLYIPLGGSQSGARRRFIALVGTMLLMGLWHGAEWKFVLWGAYHGILLAIYHSLGMGGNWFPRRGVVLAWFIWSTLTVIGWSIFRAPNLTWLSSVYSSTYIPSINESQIALTYIVGICFCALPMFYLRFVEPILKTKLILRGFNSAFLLILLVLYSADSTRPFIYFRF
jgi:D-alanyl-lipoteichoic acid acyltransferase DltB (MBOAT superfamily)